MGACRRRRGLFVLATAQSRWRFSVPSSTFGGVPSRDDAIAGCALPSSHSWPRGRSSPRTTATVRLGHSKSAWVIPSLYSSWCSHRARLAARCRCLDSSQLLVSCCSWFVVRGRPRRRARFLLLPGGLEPAVFASDHDRHHDCQVDGDREQILENRRQRPGAEGRVFAEALKRGGQCRRHHGRDRTAREHRQRDRHGDL